MVVQMIDAFRAQLPREDHRLGQIGQLFQHPLRSGGALRQVSASVETSRPGDASAGPRARSAGSGDLPVSMM